MTKKVQFTIQIPMFCASVRVIFCPHEEIIKVRPNISENSDACYMVDTQTIWFDSTKNVTPGIIAHECIHAINCIYEDKGIEITMNNDEVLAYSVEYLVDKIYDKHRAIINKRNEKGTNKRK